MKERTKNEENVDFVRTGNQFNEAEQSLLAFKNRLFENVSHELRTPLTLIKGPVSQLLKFGDLQPLAHEELVKVYRNVIRMSHLVDQLLDIKRIEAGTLKLILQNVDISKYLRLIPNMFQGLLDQKQIKYELDFPKESIFLYVDVDKFEKIIVNIISNAIKFTSSGGRIGIQLFEQNGFVEIGIWDNGIGMSEQQLETIYARFKTIGIENHLYREGLGIGLSLCKEYIRLHDADIQVKSEQGKGTLFKLVFKKGKTHFLNATISDEPLFPEPLFLSVPKKMSGYTSIVPLNGKLILVVEDNFELSNYITEILTQKGFSVKQAVNGKIGLEIAQMYQPDLIISDVMMPEMNGFELLQNLKKDERLRSIPTIFLTALADIEDKMKSLTIGVNDYLVKPFEQDELIIRIKNLIEFSQLRKQIRLSFDSLSVENSSQSSEDAFLKKIKICIEENIEKGQVTTDELAKEMAMSRSTLYREIRRITGFPAAGLLKEVRLQYARRLAESGNCLNLTDLSKRVGFSNSSYFRDQYLQRFGKDPFD